MIWLKSIAVFLVIAIVETIHGALRVKYLNRPLGDRRARQVSVVTGSVLILSIAWLADPWIGVRTVGEALGIGSLWTVLMTAFDVGIGRLVFRLPMERILREFNPARGGFLAFGMIALWLAPLIAARLHGKL